jgi:hypothetical protein
MIILDNNLLKCEVKSFYYGFPSLNQIGYDGTEPSISTPRRFFISAHAPSKLIIIPKNDIKLYINGSLNRSTGILRDNIVFRISCDQNILMEFPPSLEYRSIILNKNKEYSFETNTENTYACHTLWNFHYEEISSYELDLYQNLFDSVKNKNLDSNSDYSAFIQTCLPRERMAFKAILSLIKKVKNLPKRIILGSLDDFKQYSNIKFPDNVEIWSGKDFWTGKFIQEGLTTKAINHIFNGYANSGNPNLWLKYIAPRLCIQEKVLVLDDDTLFLGGAEEFTNSQENIVLMEDCNAFYGPNTINYFNTFYNTVKYGRNRPFVCAGAYKLNKKLTYDSSFINGLVLASRDHYDEQAATGMEVMDSDYKLLLPPKYYHGGFCKEYTDFSQLEFIHQQGSAQRYRDSIELLERVVKNN